MQNFKSCNTCVTFYTTSSGAHTHRTLDFTCHSVHSELQFIVFDLTRFSWPPFPPFPRPPLPNNLHRTPSSTHPSAGPLKFPLSFPSPTQFYFFSLSAGLVELCGLRRQGLVQNDPREAQTRNLDGRGRDTWPRQRINIANGAGAGKNTAKFRSPPPFGTTFRAPTLRTPTLPLPDPARPRPCQARTLRSPTLRARPFEPRPFGPRPFGRGLFLGLGRHSSGPHVGDTALGPEAPRQYLDGCVLE